MSNNFFILHGDCLEVLKDIDSDSVDSLVTDPPAGISFMSKAWDDDKGGRKQWVAWMTEVMRECLRVMKPGAHGLVWALPRTSHWTATALEDAGFEIRDVVVHLFGQGFPKSLDISKAIDKATGAEREVVGKSNRHTSNGQQFADGASGFKGSDNCFITAPATDAAKQWAGWGTALKPASEHWILIRKPCSEKTVAANVQKWATGGINIDGGRIGSAGGGQNGKLGDKEGSGWGMKAASRAAEPMGRFPANLILDEEAGEALDEQSGVSASRFFYCAKISSGERGEGNTHPTVKPQKLMRYLIKLITPPNSVVLDPFTGSGSTGIAALKEGHTFIGIEKEQEYVTIAENRINKALSEPQDNT